MDTPPTETASTQSKQHASKGLKLVIIVLIGGILSTGGFFGLRIMTTRSTAPRPLKVESVVELEEFLVNLSDQRTFLKASIALGVAEGQTLTEGGSKGEPPQVRDAIIMLLTSKKPDEIATYEGKELLKRQIISKVNALYKSAEKSGSSDKPTKSPNHPSSGGDTQAEEPNRGPVLEVYFTSFATQRY